ncbi:MAG: 50S ribosomal protein L18 [Phycisphaeraceae bacterium]|nr:MAG: 50S ribosomal protein L18 [Phycisphaeraceae bacterium]
MDKQKLKTVRRARRRRGLRKRLTGTPERPRLSVYRSLRHIYAQVIDDLDGRTIASASSMDSSLGLSSTGGVAAAEAVGAAVAERAKAAGVTKVVLDRGGFRYHGRVRNLADAARKSGLEF